MVSGDTQSRFVVGLDFGTTFTSVAFAHSASPEEVKLVQTWPNGSPGHSSADQVPSEVSYDPRTRAMKWGYEVGNSRRSGEPLKWFKLLLQNQSGSSRSIHPERPVRTQPQARSYRASGLEALVGGLSLGAGGDIVAMETPERRTALQLEELHTQPVTVVADFLRSVRDVTVASLERSYETQWVQRTKVEYILTVPAIWTDAAKSHMIKAAEDAGFGAHRVDFHLVSEPESAASYTLKAIQPNNLSRGDTFIICDAGGGTVDLISYRIKDLNPLRLDECVSGTGGMCGSVFLDEGFERYIRSVVGNKVIDGMKSRSKAAMMRTWEERVKFKFGNTSADLEVNLPGVPDNPAKNIEENFHTMEEDDVKRIFDPVVSRIVALVKDQVRDVERKGEVVKAILLVGGFGSSEYLLKQLQAARYGAGDKILQVLQPMNARSAIARGALLRGLDGSIVKERRARRYYGCLSCSPYFAGLGLEDHRYWDTSDDMYMVDGHLNWYIQKNMVLGSTVSTSLPFYRTVPVPAIRGMAPYLIFHDELVSCDLDDAPDYQWKNADAIRRLVSLRSDLSGIPTSKFPIRTNSMGEQYYRVEYELRLSLVDEVMRFELTIDNEVCGIVTARFE